jgi:aerobic C4-dicarboxylate transport protein
MAEATITQDTTPAPRRKPWYTVLYIQVLIAMGIGIAVGHFYPQTGTMLKPLGDAFINLIKMMIAPVIFCTVVCSAPSPASPASRSSGSSPTSKMNC